MPTSYLSRWPTQEEYTLAMHSRARTIVTNNTIHHGNLAEQLRYGDLVEQKNGSSVLGGANLYVCLYRIDDWMVRCFCANKQLPPDDIRHRYSTIAEFCRNNFKDIPALLPIHYIDEGIKVIVRGDEADTDSTLVGNVFPLVIMPRLQSSLLSLGSFIAEYRHNHTFMKQLCEAWLRMVDSLEEANVAHGDLDLTNVFVEQRKQDLQLRLIDYDSLYVPGLRDCKQVECGHRHFQHPDYSEVLTRPFDEGMDRFSALTIYISLITLTAHSWLYEEGDWGADDTYRLLLSKEDYLAEKARKANHITQLLTLNNVPELTSCVVELQASLHQRRRPRRLREILPDTAAFKMGKNPSKHISMPSRSPVLPPKEHDESVYGEYSPLEVLPPLITEPSARQETDPLPSPTPNGRLQRTFRDAGITLTTANNTSLPDTEHTYIPPKRVVTPPVTPQAKKIAFAVKGAIVFFCLLFCLVLCIFFFAH